MLAWDPSFPAPPERPIPALSPKLCVKPARSGACVTLGSGAFVAR